MTNHLGQHSLAQHFRHQILQLVEGVASSLADSLVASVLSLVHIKIVLHIGFHLLVGDLDAVHLTFVHQELVDKQTLQNVAAILESVVIALLDTQTDIAVFDVGQLDNILAHHSHHFVHHGLVVVLAKGDAALSFGCQAGN